MFDEIMDYRKALWIIAYTPLNEQQCADLARKMLDKWDDTLYYPNYIDPHTDLVGIPMPEKDGE